MVFKTPLWVPELPYEIPTTIPLGDFVLDGNKELRKQDGIERKALVCPVSGKTYTVEAINEKVDHVARSLSKHLGWSANKGNSLDKVLGILSFNSLDYIVLCWAVHRLNGICLVIHTGSTDREIELHLTRAKCSAIFACPSMLDNCTKVTDSLGITRDRVFILDVPGDVASGPVEGFKSFDELEAEGAQLSPIEKPQWQEGQAKKQIAYLAATSGTSGHQKLAQVNHYNLIANILQGTTYENYVKHGQAETGLLLLPLSHTYALAVSHMMMWRGDSVILHPRFDMMKMMDSIQKHKIERLYLVPSIVSALVKNPILLKMFDMSSVTTIVSGAAPFDKTLADAVFQIRPEWKILPGYGLTETAIIATLTSAHDTMPGSSGCLVPHNELRLLDQDGKDIDAYDKAGEVLVRGPSIIPGYFGDPEATKVLLDSENWLHTGDVGLIRVSPKGNEHLFIVDRMRDMIKVKGMQVAPTDIEARLLTHPAVKDAAVVGVPDQFAGERAHAFIVRSPEQMADLSEDALKDAINEHVEKELNEMHWLSDRITLTGEIPKNQSGKILKVKLRAQLKKA